MTVVQDECETRAALSAFVGPFYVDAAEYVVSRTLNISESEVLSRLAALVETNWLRRTVVEERAVLQLAHGDISLGDETAEGESREDARRFFARYYLTVAPERDGWTSILRSEAENLRAALWHATDDAEVAALATRAIGERLTLHDVAEDPQKRASWARSVRQQLEDGDEQLLLESRLNECEILYEAGFIEDAHGVLEAVLKAHANIPKSNLTELHLWHAQLVCHYDARDALRQVAARPRELLAKRRSVVTRVLFAAGRAALDVADDPSTALNLFDELQRRSDRDAERQRGVEITRVTALAELELYSEALSVSEAALARKSLPVRRRTWLQGLRTGIHMLAQASPLADEQVDALSPEVAPATWLRFLRASLSDAARPTQSAELLSIAEVAHASSLQWLGAAAGAAAAVLGGTVDLSRAPDPTRCVSFRWYTAVARSGADSARLAQLHALAHNAIGLDARGEPHRTMLHARSSGVRVLCGLIERVLAQVVPTPLVFEAGTDAGARALRCLQLAALLEPGTPVGIETIFGATWNEPLPDPESTANRVRVLIARLRKQGWRDRLGSLEGGYVLDAD